MSKFHVQVTFSERDGIYYAGESLTGILSLINADEVISDLKAINVIIDGRLHNYWVSKNSDKIYEKLERCLKTIINVSPSNPTSVNMVTGGRTYSFECDLSVNLPSTFDGEYGQIFYTVAIEMFNNDGELETHIEKPFTVISKVNLSKYPSTMQPVEAVDTMDFSCCSCFPFGTVRSVLTIPKNGFLPNEIIPVNVIVYNGTRRKLTDSRIILLQRTKFYAKSRYENAEDEKETFRKILEINKGTIYPHRFLRIKNEPLIVPNVVPTYDGADINISYVLRLCAIPELEVDVPIIIGTETNNLAE